MFLDRLSSSCSDTDRTIHIYTDGSCIGNQNVQVSFCPAGWGVVIIAKAFGWSSILLLFFKCLVEQYYLFDRRLENIRGALWSSCIRYKITIFLGSYCWYYLAIYVSSQTNPNLLA